VLGHRQRRIAGLRRFANADLHRGVFGKHDVSPAPKKVGVDGSAAAIGAHYDTEVVRANDQTDGDPDQLEGRSSSGDGAAFTDIIPAAASDQREAHRYTRRKVSGWGGRRLRTALSIEFYVLAGTRFDALQSCINLFRGSVGKHYFVERDPELSIVVKAARGVYLENGAPQAGALRKDELILIK